MFLVDTNVVSTLAPSKNQRHLALAQWLHEASPYLYISVITVAEIAAGIAKAERENAHTKAALLRHWWLGIEHLYGDRLLPFDLRASHAAGEMIDRARAHDPGFGDIAIAATAEVHGLIVLTQNVRHFEPLGIATANPFVTLPSLP